MGSALLTSRLIMMPLIISCACACVPELQSTIFGATNQHLAILPAGTSTAVILFSYANCCQHRHTNTHAYVDTYAYTYIHMYVCVLVAVCRVEVNADFIYPPVQTATCTLCLFLWTNKCVNDGYFFQYLSHSHTKINKFHLFFGYDWTRPHDDAFSAVKNMWSMKKTGCWRMAAVQGQRIVPVVGRITGGLYYIYGGTLV